MPLLPVRAVQSLSACTIGTGSFPGVKSDRGVRLTIHPLLVPWSKKCRAIPLLPYGPYGLYRASVPVQECTLPYLLPPREAANSSASSELSRSIWNPTIHYRVGKSLPLVFILSPINPIHTFAYYCILFKFQLT